MKQFDIKWFINGYDFPGCVCLPGWEGADCSVNINECATTDICGDPYKKCVDTIGSYECVCIEHYMLNDANDKCIGKSNLEN